MKVFKNYVVISTLYSKCRKVIEYHDVDYETAKKEVAGYFQMKGEAFASDASTDLQPITSWCAGSWMIGSQEGTMETIE